MTTEWPGILHNPDKDNPKKIDFIYNEETRIHTLNGKIIPSVSNIVEPLSMDYSKAHPGKLAYKKDLGIAFHECIRLFLTNDLDEDSIDDDLKLPMQQFEEFFTDNTNGLQSLEISSVIAVEKPFFNEKLKYCGKPDMITGDCIYDWKLRKFDPIADPLRMAGYAGLVSEYPPKSRIVVEFSLEGGYRVHDAHKPQATAMFRTLLKWYWKKQEFETLLESWRKSI